MSKYALVIGGSGGIGSAIARRLIRDGMHVCATYFSGKDKALRLSEELGSKVLSLQMMDVSDERSVAAALAAARQEAGHFDVIVYSPTAPLAPCALFDSDWAQYQRHIDVQARGLFNIAKFLKEQLKTKRKTKIIVIVTELCVTRPPSHMSPYVTAKYALMGLARTLAVELARYNCTVNMVSPGLTKTPLIGVMPPKMIEMAEEGNFMKRLASPEDTANTVSFLASDGSDYMTGVNLTVNGGGTSV